jgi:hypothetical protein
MNSAAAGATAARGAATVLLEEGPPLRLQRPLPKLRSFHFYYFFFICN